MPVDDGEEMGFTVTTTDGKTIRKETNRELTDVRKIFSILKRMLPKDVSVYSL